MEGGWRTPECAQTREARDPRRLHPGRDLQGGRASDLTSELHDSLEHNSDPGGDGGGWERTTRKREEVHLASKEGRNFWQGELSRIECFP